MFDYKKSRKRIKIIDFIIRLNDLMKIIQIAIFFKCMWEKTENNDFCKINLLGILEGKQFVPKIKDC